MATVKGYITRSTANLQGRTSAGAMSSITLRPYKATFVNGGYGGEFHSVQEAQACIDSSSGQKLRWTREARIDGIEAYIGEAL